MKQNYTQNDLVSYIYDELDILEKLEIEDSIENDWSLKNAYNELMEGFNQLPKLRFRPSLSSIANILQHSKQAMVEVSC